MRNLFIAFLLLLAGTAFGQATKENKTESVDTVSAHIPLPPELGQPLFFLDGKRVENIDKINLENLSSVKMISDPAELAVYGEAGKYGVILMQSKLGVNPLNTAPVSLRNKENEKEPQ